MFLKSAYFFKKLLINYYKNKENFMVYACMQEWIYRTSMLEINDLKKFIIVDSGIICKIFVTLYWFMPHPDFGQHEVIQNVRIVNLTHKKSISFVRIMR